MNKVVIGRLQSLKGKGLDKEDFAQLCDRILALTKEMKAGQQMDSPAQLLREIMGLMDVKDLKDSKYLFKLARCALALLSVDAATAGVPISGVQAAYQNIAQVLFKYSQKEPGGNDAEFLSAKLIEPLIEVLESTSDSYLQVYIVGILKNVSNDSANQKLLAQRGAVTALFKLMEPFPLLSAEDDCKILTGTPKEVPLLIQDHLNALTNVMATYAGHVELLTNVARILAKLTLHDKAAEALARSDVHLRQIVATLRSNVDSVALCLRLLFVLGNLTERSDRLRTVFAFEPGRLIQDCEGTALVPELLGKYWQKERQHSAEKSKANSAAGAASEFEEVLVKLVRLLANVAISPSAGPTLAASSAVSEPLLDMLGAKRISDSEELVLNVVAAITNLLFYDVPANLLFHEDGAADGHSCVDGFRDGHADESKQLLCRLFRPLLLESYNVEALVETARALGNLSRHADARRCMASLRLDEILVILLDHDDRDLVFYSCGALDSECIPRLAGSTPAVQKLAKLLGDAPCSDPMLQLVAVKVLTNLSLDSRAAWPVEDVELVAGDEERQQLIDLARHLQGRLPAAPDPPAPATSAPADGQEDDMEKSVAKNMLSCQLGQGATSWEGNGIANPGKQDATNNRGWVFVREPPVQRPILPVEMLHLQGFPARDPMLAKALQGLTDQDVLMGAGNAMSVPVIGAVLADVFVKTLVGRLDVAMEVSESEEDDEAFRRGQRLSLRCGFSALAQVDWESAWCEFSSLQMRLLVASEEIGGWSWAVSAGGGEHPLRATQRASGLVLEASGAAQSGPKSHKSVLSRLHAEIIPGRQPCEAFLRDLGSTNGTWVLGKGRVNPQDVDGEALASGDEISLGVDPATWQGSGPPDPEDFRFLFRVEMHLDSSARVEDPKPSPKRRRLSAGVPPNPTAPHPTVPSPSPSAEALPSAAETIAALEMEEKTWWERPADAPESKPGCCCRVLLSECGVRFGAGLLVPLQSAAAGYPCRVPLQGAAAECSCRVLLSERGVRCGACVLVPLEVNERPSRKGLALPRVWCLEKSRHCFHKLTYQEEYRKRSFDLLQFTSAEPHQWGRGLKSWRGWVSLCANEINKLSWELEALFAMSSWDGWLSAPSCSSTFRFKHIGVLQIHERMSASARYFVHVLPAEAFLTTKAELEWWTLEGFGELKSIPFFNVSAEYGEVKGTVQAIVPLSLPELQAVRRNETLLFAHCFFVRSGARLEDEVQKLVEAKQSPLRGVVSEHVLHATASVVKLLPQVVKPKRNLLDSEKDMEPSELSAVRSTWAYGTPSFAAAEAATGSTPKASSVKNLSLPPPPTASLDAVEDVLGFTTHSHQQVTSVVRPDEYAKLREELAAAEARSTRHYEEMREYKSWLAQVEDEAYAAGQPDPVEEMREYKSWLAQVEDEAYAAGQPDPVPDNPPGLWDQHEGSNVERGS
eukprot:s4514_g1.t1